MNLDKNDYDSNFGDSVVAAAAAKRLQHLYLIGTKTHVEIEQSWKVPA